MKFAWLSLILMGAQDRRAETVLRVSWTPPGTLDPHKVSTLSESRFALAMFEGLTTHGADGVTVAPGMAESWQSSADGREWTFRLREARWSNGDPVTAHDFVAAWRRALRLETGCPFVPLFRGFRGVEPWLAAGEKRPDVEQADLGFEAVDARTLRVGLERRAPWLPDLLAFVCFVPVHEKTISTHGPAWVQPGKIVTNGPYLFDSATPADLALRKNPKYWDGGLVAAPDRIAVGLHTEAVALRRYRDGALDWIAGEQIPAGEWRVQKDLVRFDAWGTAFLRLNCARPPFEKPAVRAALAAGIDRPKLVEGTPASPANRLVPPGFAGYPEVAGISFDKAAAVEGLLREANFDLSKFPALEILTPDGLRFVAVAQLLKDHLEQTLGVAVKVRVMKWPAYSRALAAGEYLAALGLWMGEYFDPASFLELWRKGHPENFTGWSSGEYDALVAAALEEGDAKKRLETLARAESLLLKGAAVIPLYGAWDGYLASPRVAGLAPNLMSRFPVKHLRIR